MTTIPTTISRAGDAAPIMQRSDDRFGYSAIAEGLAQSISRLDSNISTVIGIEGKWGAGKSSLLNLLETQLRPMVSAETQILKFSPWLSAPDESPVTALLLTVAAKLEQVENPDQKVADKISPLAEKVLTYTQQTSRRLAPLAAFAGEFIPGLGLVAKGMDAVSGTDLARRSKTTAEIRAEIEQRIEELGVNFIVIIDDLDRLEPVQAVEVLRMVRSVADFSRFRYVMCYDRDVLAHAVERGLNVEDGHLYLQKIIPLSFILPRPESFALRREFREGALSLWHEVNGADPDDDIKITLAHYVEVYGEGLTTPREVTQALNAVRFRYPGLRDYVYYPDLCLLQLLSTVNPDFAAWTEHYLTEWSVVKNRDSSNTREMREMFTGRLEHALAQFGPSRARSMWELPRWLPGISGFDSKTVSLFEDVNSVADEQAIIRRRLSSSIYWRYYFSFSAPQNVMPDADFQEILKLAASDYAGLEKRLIESVSDNGVSSRTWFEHILTRLTPDTTEKAGPRVQRNLLKFFFRCSDQILPYYRKRDIFFRQEHTGIDAVVTQLSQQLLAAGRESAISLLCRYFRKARASVWATIYLYNIRGADAVSPFNEGPIYSQEEYEKLKLSLNGLLGQKGIRNRFPQVPYLVIFLYAWKYIAGEEEIRAWQPGPTLSDKDFLLMLLNMRTAVNSSNLGIYLKLDLDSLSDVFGVSGLDERLVQIRARKPSALLTLIREVDEAISLSQENV